MLFPFLSELNRDVFNDLPWDMQRIIADFHPNLPHLSRCVMAVLHAHFSTRYCKDCGRFVPKWNKRYHCLCRRKYYSQRYHSSVRNFKIYYRPFHVFEKPHATLAQYNDAVAMTPEYLDLYVSSNQQPFTYNMKRLLQKTFLQVWMLCLRYRYNVQKVARTSLNKTINTNTCLRTYLDSFVDNERGTEEGVVFFNAFDRAMTQNRNVWYAQPRQPPRVRHHTAFAEFVVV